MDFRDFPSLLPLSFSLSLSNPDLVAVKLTHSNLGIFFLKNWFQLFKKRNKIGI
jgi:hypothetical protein